MPCIARPCHSLPRQSIPYTMLCLSGHTLCHDMPTRPLHIPYHAMPNQALTYTIPCLPSHTINHDTPCRPCHACMSISYTTPCPLGQTIYLTMPARSYHIPCHAMANEYFGKSCHLSKGVNGFITRYTTACK